MFESRVKIVILGGGISGLSAAFYGRKKYKNAQITLIEKTDRLGGWMQTRVEKGFLFEWGPRTFALDRCPHLLNLIEEIGLKEQLIYSDPCAKRRFLWYKGKLRPMVFFLPKLILSLLREPFIAKGDQADESIYDFVSRRLGSHTATLLIDAMTLGIYAEDSHQLSIRSCFPFLYQWEQQRGSLTLGALPFLFSKRKKRGLFTLQKGMQTLISALAEQSKADICLNAAIEEIRPDGVVANGKFYPADFVISALSGSVIGCLTGLWKDFRETHVEIVHLVFRGEVLPKKGFGYLVPTSEKENLLGMVWDSAIFPQQNTRGETRITAIMRTSSIEEVLDCMQRHLGVSTPPILASMHNAKGAIAKFYVGYEERLACFEKEIKQRYPSLLLLGNYLRGVSVDTCISLARQLFQ